MKSSIGLSQNPYLQLLATAWRYAREEQRRFLLVYGLFLGANLTTMAGPVIFGWFIEQLQVEGFSAVTTAWKYIGLIIGLHLLFWSLHFPGRILERTLAFRLSRRMLEELYHKTLQLPVRWHQDHHSGNTINRVRKAYEALKSFFDFGFAYFSTFVRLFLSLAGIVYFAPLFGLVALVSCILIFWMIRRFDRPFVEASLETNEREHELSSALFDSLANIITVITLRLEQRMNLNLHQRIDAVWPPFLRVTWVNEYKWFSVGTAMKVLYGIIVLGYVYQTYVPGELFLVGGLVSLIGFINQFDMVFKGFSSQYTQIVRHYADVQSAQLILDAYDEYYRPAADVPIKPDWNTLSIANLTFYHASQSRESPPALNQISLSAQRGERIALIGESGSGKSTLLAVLRGLYEPQCATIHIDGELVSSVADRVTLIPQEPEIFEHTLRYNINLGLPIEGAQLAQVLEWAAFKEVVEQLPEGLDSHIKEKGVNLSGGQKQRLALARGILAAKGSDLVLLDEPTSSVDPKTELAIYQRLFAAFSDKLMISSLHRLHLLPHFDRVYLMEAGKIIAVGTFEELLASSSAFQQLWAHQEEVVGIDRTT